MADRIAVIDYGMGNLHSVSKAIECASWPTLLRWLYWVRWLRWVRWFLGLPRVEITSDPDRVAAADRVIFPGQGAMPDCMREMDARGLRPAVLEAARTKPFLGICIGLQMLFESSDEGGVAGLGLLPGTADGKIQGFQLTKLARSRRPAVWLFSGWNCTAKMLSRATAQVKGTP